MNREDLDALHARLVKRYIEDRDEWERELVYEAEIGSRVRKDERDIADVLVKISNLVD